MRAVLLLLLCCLTGAAHAAADQAAGPALLTLIIDDLGQTPSRDSRALALPGPVTLAIMPDTPHAAEFARQAHDAGKTVIIHMPMDPATGPFAWHPDLPDAELQKRLDAAFKAVPFASGMNNHEGSRMTSQPAAMAMLMGRLQQRGMFFLDSRTSAKTVAAAKAQDIGLPSLSRDVFLDDVRTPQAITAQLQTAIKFAHKHGTVVMIGHPYPQTLDVLERELPKLASQGVKWIAIKDMVKERGNLAIAAHGKNGIYHGASLAAGTLPRQSRPAAPATAVATPIAVPSPPAIKPATGPDDIPEPGPDPDFGSPAPPETDPAAAARAGLPIPDSESLQ
jgi:polysaccharide deacetylase 2 family uncharacterized protein YibQ